MSRYMLSTIRYEVWNRDTEKMLDDAFLWFDEAEKFALNYLKLNPDAHISLFISWYGGMNFVKDYDKHADDRDKKNWKKRFGMQVSNRSLKNTIYSYMKKGKKK